MDFAARQSDFADALLDPRLPPPSGLTSAGGRNDPLRFAVYRNNVFVGLTRALAKRFPVTERLVGEDFFAGMARAFAALEKPKTPLLFHYGESFPEFIAAFRPAAGLPYLADIARLEMAYTRAYHAADIALIPLAQIGAIDPQALGGVCFTAHPAASLIRSAYPIGSVWAAHQQATVEPVASRNAETVLVARPELEVTVTILPPRDAGFAAALLAGEHLGEAASAALSTDPTFDFGAALVGLVSLGAFAAVTVEGEMS